MHPVLFHLGSWAVPTYGFLGGLGFVIMMILGEQLARQEGLDPKRVSDLMFWTGAAGFVGGRTLYVLTQLEYFLDHPMQVFDVTSGGFTFFGGVLLAFPFFLIQVRRSRLPVWKVLDVTTPALALGHAIGRVGCFAAGCCYGRPTTSVFGTRFYSELVDPSLRGIPLLPTQLFEAAGLLVLFAILVSLLWRKISVGIPALTYFGGYAVLRFVVEIFRADSDRGTLFGLSTSQFVSLVVLFAVGLTAAWRVASSVRDIPLKGDARHGA